MTFATQFRWTSASRSDVGLVRQINEDAYLDQPERGVWVVADGMGGHAVGDFASRLIVEILSNSPSPNSLVNLVAAVRERLQHVNQELRAEAFIRNVQIIGSTVVALLTRDRQCACLWAGDSRIYLCRNGLLRQLTRDHTQWEERKSQGFLNGEDAVRQSSRNVITRAVGATDTLILDEEIVEISDGDIFLLCSDGLTKELSDTEILGALIPGNCQHTSEDLVNRALQRGGRDNISAVVVYAEDLYGPDKTLFNPAL